MRRGIQRIQIKYNQSEWKGILGMSHNPEDKQVDVDGQ